MTFKTSVSLSDQQAAFARKLVEEGRYSSLSAVIQHGLDRLQTEREAEMAETEALKQLLEERRREVPISMEESRAMVEELIAEKRRELGLDS